MECRRLEEAAGKTERKNAEQKRAEDTDGKPETQSREIKPEGEKNQDAEQEQTGKKAVAAETEHSTEVVQTIPAFAEQRAPEIDKSEKAARLQYLLQHIITEAVRTANEDLCNDVKESILKELDYQFRMQEERDEERWKKEEEHYRRIDEMIRERHNAKEKTKKSKRKSPVSL